MTSDGVHRYTVCAKSIVLSQCTPMCKQIPWDNNPELLAGDTTTFTEFDYDRS
jgi:hypothetical protein